MSGPRNRLRGALEAAERWARGVKIDIVALYLAARDGRTPVAAKIVAALVVAYALSPIDLIPDFVPVLGYLDDLLIVPLGILCAIRLIPAALFDEFRRMAAGQGRLPASRVGAALVACVWIAGAAATVWWLAGG